MLQPTIEEVAHHEAGHAVGMVHLEKDFIRVTVLPEVHKGRETLGYLKPRRYWSYHISNKIWAWAEDGGGEITDLELRAHFGHEIITRDLDNGSIAMCGASTVDRKGGKQWPVITPADCDVIVGWYPPEQRAYAVLPIGKTLYTFRRQPSKNGQIIGVWFEADYRLTHLKQLLP